MTNSPELTDAALARLVFRAIAGLIALVLAAGVATVVTRWDEKTASAADEVALPLHALDAIGPVRGQAIATYVRVRTAALARASADDRRVAVVSFDRYLTADRAASAIGSLTVEGFTVAAPGGEATAVDSSSLRRWADAQRAHADGEQAELERLLPTVDDPEFARSYQDDIERLKSLESAARADGAVVFGAVLVGRVDVLRRLASRAEVRLVDLGPSADTPDWSQITALRPEETSRAGEPRYRPHA